MFFAVHSSFLLCAIAVVAVAFVCGLLIFAFFFVFGSYISNGLFALCVWCGDDGGKLCRVFGVSTIVATVDFFLYMCQRRAHHINVMEWKCV